ncbi:UNVERIFIED_CONTAM: hypothetical protein FKN15_019382 [Acipenser sinensis]
MLLFQHFWLLVVTRGLVGVGEASYSTIAPTIIGDLFTGALRTWMLSLFYIFIPVGSGLGYIVGSSVADITGDWHWALRVTPILGMVGIVLLIALVPEPPRGGADLQGEALKERTSYWEDIKYLLANRSFVLSSLGVTAMAFMTGALAFWTPVFLSHAQVLQGTRVHCTQEPCSNTDSLIFGVVTVVTGIVGVGIGAGVARRLKKSMPDGDPLLCAVGMLGSAPCLYLAMVTADKSIATSYTGTASAGFSSSSNTDRYSQCWLLIQQQHSQVQAALASHPAATQPGTASAGFSSCSNTDRYSQHWLHPAATQTGTASADFSSCSNTARYSQRWLLILQQHRQVQPALASHPAATQPGTASAGFSSSSNTARYSQCFFLILQQHRQVQPALASHPAATQPGTGSAGFSSCSNTDRYSQLWLLIQQQHSQVQAALASHPAATQTGTASSGFSSSSNTASLIFGVVTVVTGIVGVGIGAGVARRLKKSMPDGDPLLCAVGMLGSAPCLYLAMVTADKSIATSYVFIALGETLLSLNWAVVADILLYVVIPTRRSTAEALQITVCHLLGDAGSPYLIGTISDSLRSSYPDSYLWKFRSLEYSFLLCPFVGILGGLFFLLTTLYVEKDRTTAREIAAGNV